MEIMEVSAEKCGTIFMIDLWTNGGYRHRVVTLVGRNLCGDAQYTAAAGISQGLCAVCLVDCEMCVCENECPATT